MVTKRFGVQRFQSKTGEFETLPYTTICSKLANERNTLVNRLMGIILTRPRIHLKLFAFQQSVRLMIHSTILGYFGYHKQIIPIQRLNVVSVYVVTRQ
jgi:hypothetical protein